MDHQIKVLPTKGTNLDKTTTDRASRIKEEVMIGSSQIDPKIRRDRITLLRHPVQTAAEKAIGLPNVAQRGNKRSMLLPQKIKIWEKNRRISKGMY